MRDRAAGAERRGLDRAVDVQRRIEIRHRIAHGGRPVAQRQHEAFDAASLQHLQLKFEE